MNQELAGFFHRRRFPGQQRDR